MTSEEQHFFSVLLESFESKVNVIADGHIALVEGQKQTNAKLDRIESDVGVLKSDVGVLKSDVGVLKSDVGVLKGTVERLEKGQARLEKKVDGIATQLTARVCGLETDVKALKDDMGRVKGRLDLNA